MITREQVMEFFRSDKLDEQLKDYDKFEIMVACCSQSDYLEQRVLQAIKDYEEEEE